MVDAAFSPVRHRHERTHVAPFRAVSTDIILGFSACVIGLGTFWIFENFPVSGCSFFQLALVSKSQQGNPNRSRRDRRNVSSMQPAGTARHISDGFGRKSLFRVVNSACAYKLRCLSLCEMLYLCKCGACVAVAIHGRMNHAHCAGVLLVGCLDGRPE